MGNTDRTTSAGPTKTYCRRLPPAPGEAVDDLVHDPEQREHAEHAEDDGHAHDGEPVCVAILREVARPLHEQWEPDEHDHGSEQPQGASPFGVRRTGPRRLLTGSRSEQRGVREGG